MSFLRHLCLDEQIRIIELTVHTCRTYIANESIGEYGWFSANDGLNDGLKLSERSLKILSLVEMKPNITVDEIALNLQLSKPTAEREMTLL